MDMILAGDIFLWGLVGLATGIILALTGTGGSIISIPILMMVGGYDIKDASGYGLLSLSVSSAITWFFQRDNTHYPITIILIIFATLTAFVAAPIKEIMPSWIIIVLLNIACVFSLYSVWYLREHRDQDEPDDTSSFPYHLKFASIGGVMTGIINTLTGLGGGVLIIPWLAGIVRLSFAQARACSLLTVVVIAPVSAWRQGTINIKWFEWVALIVMIIVASYNYQKGHGLFNAFLIDYSEKSVFNSGDFICDGEDIATVVLRFPVISKI